MDEATSKEELNEWQPESGQGFCASGSVLAAIESGEESPMRLYHTYASPAELIVPYRLIPKSQDVFSVWTESRYRGPIFNMDFPWLVSMGAALAMTALVAVLQFGLKFLGFSDRQLSDLLFISAAFPLMFLICSPVIYPLMVGLNLRAAYFRTWLSALVGPTHVGVTDSGFKFYWRGLWFYCYPMLALWSEIFDIDLIEEEQYPLPSLQFVYQTGFGRRNTILPLTGFQSAADLQFVLSSFARYVPKENQGEELLRMGEDDFHSLVEQFRQLTEISPCTIESETSNLLLLPESKSERSG